MTRAFACASAVLSASLAVACGGGSHAKPAAVPTPTHSASASPAPTLTLDAFDRASFSIACDEVAIAQGASQNGTPAEVSERIDTAATSMSKIPDPTVQNIASVLRAASADSLGGQVAAITTTLALCKNNGVTPSP